MIVCMYILSSPKRHRPWNPLWRVIFRNCLLYGIYLHLYTAANIVALPRISWSCDIARHESILVRYHNNRTDTKIVGLSRCNHLVYKILPKGHINVYTDSLNLTISGVMFSISKNNTWSGVFNITRNELQKMTTPARPNGAILNLCSRVNIFDFEVFHVECQSSQYLYVQNE